jgi:ribonuclease HI
VKGIREWLPGWKKRGWRTAAGEPVKNQPLWEESYGGNWVMTV